ncbi:MAG TPA: FAD:protein FMN transferase, partial [Burkholderiaceae bacterium]|nr:FAD:protein FMN transferase [Burkholderiaceae bacterium]
ARRIEAKFSRYRDDSVVSALHQAHGRPITVDAETARLLDFARQCHSLSGGLFDITSGVLRRAWKFDGSDRLPSPATIAALLPFVGFQRLDWQRPVVALPEGMELDFGGIGKEYAVDRVLGLLSSRFDLAMLVAFGGDLCANRAPCSGSWQVGIERPDAVGRAGLVLALRQGALATSGDAHRFLLREGRRYSHLLNPMTGWPVANGPRSITVAADSCMAAGMLATLSLLHGKHARDFLVAQGVKYWCLQ